MGRGRSGATRHYHDDARKRLEMYALLQAQLLVRDKVLAAASDLVDDDVPETLVNQEIERRLRDMAQRLEDQMPGVFRPLEGLVVEGFV